MTHDDILCVMLMCIKMSLISFEVKTMMLQIYKKIALAAYMA